MRACMHQLTIPGAQPSREPSPATPVPTKPKKIRWVAFQNDELDIFEEAAGHELKEAASKAAEGDEGESLVLVASAFMEQERRLEDCDETLTCVSDSEDSADIDGSAYDGEDCGSLLHAAGSSPRFRTFPGCGLHLKNVKPEHIDATLS